ncbi:hypothetical protein HRI_003942400 [Hibiscus trionum]|uniref:Uncharacterized protein n=1 Tax=Hibiscus trionum TaxID=183268 RepID=A0A9W7IX61_HIBTR|nr:hypothetical protein HRI_003942400 [Hibiscus trionum]
MSRCFPYPPPRLLKQGSVESIKPERERVLPKTEQKLHKREKKEKRKDKKDNYKTLSPTKKLKKLDDVLNGYKVEDQLEKSDLTEEHEQPVCYISDGSQNSHKRKRETVSYTECRVDGNKIKIKFSLKKPRQSDTSIVEEPSSSNQELSCSVPPLPERKRLHGDVRKGQGSSSVPSCLVPSIPEQKPFHDDGRNGQGPSSLSSCSVAPAPLQNLWHNDGRKEQGPSFRTSSKDKKVLKTALQYKTLIEDWLPPVLQPELNDDDSGDDWLLPKNPLVKPPAKSSDSNDVPCLSSTSWPRAQYLQGAEIYALPYTVPF